MKKFKKEILLEIDAGKVSIEYGSETESPRVQELEDGRIMISFGNGILVISQSGEAELAIGDHNNQPQIKLVFYLNGQILLDLK